MTPPFLWPRLLEPPPADVLLVYLDMNHWIALSSEGPSLCGEASSTIAILVSD